MASSTSATPAAPDPSPITAPAPSSAVAPARPGLLDLEKELSCSICTDTLYQPLTLLDCLHTFCGGCLKPWFAFQCQQADTDIDASEAHVMNPYTCPSCRAHVRGTRPDAKITTLLDMYLAVNPGKGKTQEEMAEQREKYHPGDDVVPRLKERVEDVRMVREARMMRVREEERTRRRRGGGYQRGIRHEAGSRGGDGRDADRERAAQQLGHQSSLRSLISMGDLNSEELEEEILRQIVEEDLLVGIDLTNENIPVEELGEMIAAAYRRRHGHRLGSGQRDSSRDNRPADAQMRREASGQGRESRRNSGQSQAAQRSPARSPPRSPGRSSGRAHSRSTSDVQTSSRPPISHGELLQAYPADGRRRQRSSDARTRSRSRSRTAATPPGAAGSRTDLAIRTTSSEAPRRAARTASGSDVPPHRHVFRESPTTRSPLQSSPVHSPPQSPPATGRTSSRTNSLTASAMAPTVTPIEHTQNQHPIAVSDAHYPAGMHVTASSNHRRASSFSNSVPGVSRLQSQGYPEPSIKCERCNKEDIQYQVHYNCQTCKNGRYNICVRCYKAGKGCLVWYGFGRTAWKKYQQKGAPSNDLPHILLGTRYRRPEKEELAEKSPTEGRLVAKEPAQKRRKVGAFCYACQAYAEDFFYKCDTCNEGEWGFCKNCVNRGNCCTHPLLPLAWVSSSRFKTSASDSARGVQASFSPITDPAMIQPFPPSNTGTPRQYRPLTISTTCDVCRSAIVPNQMRFHCPQCNEGCLEICSPCYSGLEDRGVISHEDGADGWRRCPQKHRMIILAFDDAAIGQRRIVLNDLVGGHFLLDQPDSASRSGAHTRNDVSATGANAERRYLWQEGDKGHVTTLSRPQTADVSGNGNGTGKFPPDGGVGKRCWAKWSWIPEDGVEDELLFPRGAEVTEVLDVTDEWCEGAYAGKKGIFPASFVRTLDVVTM